MGTLQNTADALESSTPSTAAASSSSSSSSLTSTPSSSLSTPPSRTIPRVIPSHQPLTFVYRKQFQSNNVVQTTTSTDIITQQHQQQIDETATIKDESRMTQISEVIMMTNDQPEPSSSHFIPPIRLAPSSPPPLIASSDIITDSACIAAISPSFKNASYLSNRQQSLSFHPNQYRGKYLNAKQIIAAEQYHLYPSNIAAYPTLKASPSVYPAKKYCDMTHLPTSYTEPQTRLHFLDPIRYHQIHQMTAEEVRARLDSRKAQRMEI